MSSLETDAGTYLVLLAKNLRQFQEKFLILLPSLLRSLLLSPLSCSFSFEEALVRRLLILYKGLEHFVELCKYIRRGFPLFICFQHGRLTGLRLLCFIGF